MKKIKLIIDKRTELLGVLYNLSIYKEKFPHLNQVYGSNSNYLDFMNNWFKNFKNHNTVKLFNEIVDTLNFSYNAPIDLFLRLNEDFSVGSLDEKTFRKRLKASPLVLEMLNSLKEFAKESKFEDYYNANSAFYNECLKIANLDVNANYDVYKMLSDFYGEQVHNLDLKINLLPFATGGSFGPTINGQPYPCISMSKNRNSNIAFGTNYIPHIIHEFSHHFINPLTDEPKCVELTWKINYSDSNKESLKKIAYNNSKVITNEYIVRAVTSTICRPYLNEELKQNDYIQNINSGFKHIDFFIDKIKENQGQSKHISNYCETMITEFSEYMENKNELTQ